MPEPTSPAPMAIDSDILWDMLCGADSLLALFAKTQALRHLVHDLSIETVETPEFVVVATIDPDDPTLPLITVSTGCHDRILERARQACALAREGGAFAWKRLGWKRSAFATDEAFASFLTRVTLDFMVLHELCHVVRGHVDRYVRLGPPGLAEAGESPPAGLPPWRRLALELDADSVALYHLVNLTELLHEHCPPYQQIPSTGVFGSTLGFAIGLLFGLLSEGDAGHLAPSTDTLSLADRHRALTHPLPGVRQEFANLRIQQLAIDSAERRVFRRALTRASALLLELAARGLFPQAQLTAWQYDAVELADFINLLIEEIEAASREGWMDGESRLAQTMNALDALEVLDELRRSGQD